MLTAISILKWSLDFVCKQGGITQSKDRPLVVQIVKNLPAMQETQV